MEKILEASLGGDERFGGRIDSQYLAQQGMVFTIYSNRFLSVTGTPTDWESWGEQIGANTLALVHSTLSPMTDVLPPEAIEEIEVELESSMDELRNKDEASRVIREELEKMREELREQKEILRDNLRELRQVEREKFRADEEKQQELDEQKKKIEQQIANNKEAMNQYNAKIQAYREKRLAKLNEKKQSLIDDSIKTLCEYKASLKSLQNDEYVTLIFDNFGRTSGNDDEIYVFQKSKLKNCEVDESGLAAIKKSAIIYQQ